LATPWPEDAAAVGLAGEVRLFADFFAGDLAVFFFAAVFFMAIV